MIRAFFRFALLMCLAWSGHAQQREQRVALFIGNGAYQSSPLKNPVNDATDMAKALKEKGLAVPLRTNIGTKDMRQAIRTFSQALKAGGVGLFYFAGHSVQSKGRNYLIPLNAEIKEEFGLEDEAFDANRVLAGMEEAGNRLNIVILDACRDNPFGRAWRTSATSLTFVGTSAAMQSSLHSVRYTAPASGLPTLNVHVTDENNLSTDKKILVSILENEAPLAGGDFALTGITEDQAGTLVIKPPTVRDSDSAVTPSQLRILSVEGGLLSKTDGESIVLGHTGTLLNLAGDRPELKITLDSNRTEAAPTRYVVVDPASSGLNSAASIVTVPITSVNDAPVVLMSTSALSFTEKSDLLGLTGTVKINAVDSTLMLGAQVKIIQGKQSGDVLIFVALAGSAIKFAQLAALGADA